MRRSPEVSAQGPLRRSRRGRPPLASSPARAAAASGAAPALAAMSMAWRSGSRGAGVWALNFGRLE
jgi:hypothetical protein